jgi:hypothetical protein
LAGCVDFESPIAFRNAAGADSSVARGSSIMLNLLSNAIAWKTTPNCPDVVVDPIGQHFAANSERNGEDTNETLVFARNAIQSPRFARKSLA